MAAYIIARVKVNDPEAYKEYTAQTPDAIAKYGGKFLVRAGRMELLEGDNPELSRTVVVEFPSYERALEFYHSDDYQGIVKIRWQTAESQLLVVEGV